MTIAQTFELTKNFITKIRKEKTKSNIAPGATLFINVDKFINEDELVSIFCFDATIRKICKLEEIIYICNVDGEPFAFKKGESHE